MYNHYIPQSDGSYRRNSVPDRQRQQSRNPQQSQQPQKQPPKQRPHPEPPKDPPCPPQPQPQQPARQSESILDFLKGLFPREIDAADLMVLFLLLLMNRDEDDDFSPMLTMALYFLL